MLSYIQHSAEKMGKLIDDLLIFARSGKQALQKTGIDMNVLINDVLNDLKRTVHYRAELKINSLLPAEGDYSLIKQVVINLVSNAIKYSSKKEAPLIEITSELKETQVVYTIKDNGEGFDMKYADKLFGVFQRLHTHAEFEGTGVGLAIVQRILNKHGGKVYATAEVGKGASFSFTLPPALDFK